MLSWEKIMAVNIIGPTDAHMGIFGMVNLIWSW